ncbi:MAG: leucine-rich repeat domain-containing protein [Chloroflexi bacterium]|nr:leucine-rich repeat domain-containing protein [Chloroflexota bacterium]
MAWSSDGSELFFMDGQAISVVSADGWRLERMATTPISNVGQDWSFMGLLTSLAVAPDASQLVYTACVDSPVEPTREGDVVVVIVGTNEGHHYDLFRASRDGARVVRLTESLNDETYGVWSPDGRRLAFLAETEPARVSDARLRLFTMAADATDVRQVLSEEFAVLHDLPQWSPDGRHLAVVRYRNTRLIPGIPIRGRELYVVDADGAEPRRLAADVVSGSSWSPDGQRLAYARANADGVGLYTIRMDGTDETLVRDIPEWRDPIRNGPEEHPAAVWIDTVAWSPDGARILVRSNSGHPARVVTLQTGETTELGIGDVLAAAWSPDGSRIAVLGRLDPSRALKVATMAASGTDVRVLAEDDEPSYANLDWVAGRGRYLPGPEDEAACRTGGAVSDPDANERLAEQCVELIRVQRSLVGGEALNWNPERPMAEWDGVVLAGTPPVVREVDLGGRGLRGALAQAVPWVPNLRVLVLRDNRLDGPIPRWLGNSLAELEVVDLSGNQLTGPIPSTLGGPQNERLRTLDLSSNQLSGDIPARLAELPNLQEIALAGNQFTGCVPPGLPLRDRDELNLPTCEPTA